jgi:hypothetical protein
MSVMMWGVTEKGIRAFLRHRQQKNERDRKAWENQHRAVVEDRQHIPDAELIASAPGIPGPQHEMERRLKAAVVELTGELVNFRETSDGAATRMERLTRWLIGFTVALTALTVVIVVLTAVLLAKG